MRSGAREHERESDKRPSIPITVRSYYFLGLHSLVYCFLLYVSYFSPAFFLFCYLFLNRQLEAVVRIAESLAKMKLQAVAGEEEVDEALRLFQVSTLDAALSGSLSGERFGVAPSPAFSFARG